MTIDFGSATYAALQTFGQPGRRTFRLLLRSGGERAASLWLEKEHIHGLSLALKQVLNELDYDPDSGAENEPGETPTVSETEFRVGRMGLGLDPASRRVVLQADEVDLPEGEGPTLRVWLSDSQCAALVSQANNIIEAGRPLCPLCSSPIDPGGHACVRANGHSLGPIPDNTSENDDPS